MSAAPADRAASPGVAPEVKKGDRVVAQEGPSRGRVVTVDSVIDCRPSGGRLWVAYLGQIRLGSVSTEPHLYYVRHDPRRSLVPVEELSDAAH